MSDADDARAKVVAMLDSSIETYLRSYKRWQFIQWLFTAIIAAAGVTTSTAGITGIEGSTVHWYGSHAALLVYGLMGAVAASLNQATDPGRKSQFNHNKKFALRMTKGALDVGRISAIEAERVWELAIKDPDKAFEALSPLRTSMMPNEPSA